MIMPTVVVVVMAAVAAVSAAFGLEGGLNLYKISFEATEHILDHMVGANAENLVSNFSRQMPISQMPGKTQKLIGILMPDFDNRLRSGLNLQSAPIVKLQAISIGHSNCFRKVEKDIFALVGSQPNAAAMARVEVKGESALPPVLSAKARRGDELKRECMVRSVHEIALCHWQYFCGFAGEKAAISPHFIGFRVNLHTRGGAIQHHRMLADLARVRDSKKLFCKSKHLAFFKPGLADERNRAFRQAAAEGTEHWPVIFRLGARNGRIRVAHNCGGDHAALQHDVRLHAEKGWIPDTEISKLPDFNRADISGNALCYRGIDRVFRDIAPYPEIVVVAFVFRQPSELFLHFICGLPCT